MSKTLTINDIDEKVIPLIYSQQYPEKKIISDVKLIDLNTTTDDEGDFSEVIRINKGGEIIHFPGFIIQQINRSVLYPKAVKAWHLHFNQEEIWYVVASDHLLVALWDVRNKSATNGLVNRMIMGGGKSQLLFIPRGVAHGSANISHKATAMWYFTNQHFDKNNPDEKRIKWNAQGEDFWLPQRD